MTGPEHAGLSRRERQIVDVLYRLKEASAAEVTRHLGDEVSLDSIRVTLAILEKKGYVTHRRDGPRNVYQPTVAAERASRSALKHVMRTFFSGSPTRAIVALLDSSSGKLSRQELDEIAEMIEHARKRRG